MGKTINKITKKPYDWVAHSLQDPNFRKRIVRNTKGVYNRKKEKQINLNDQGDF